MEKKKAEIINLPKIFDPRGSLTVAEAEKNLPFNFQRVSYIYNLQANKSLVKNTQDNTCFYVALSGSFSITIYDNGIKNEFFINHPYQGLLIHENTSYSIHNFSNGVVCLEIS